LRDSRWAGQIQSRILHIARDVAAIVDLAGFAVLPSERWQRRHHAGLPDEGLTGEKSTVAAKVLAVRVVGRRFG
jgi:hypothetical protein